MTIELFQLKQFFGYIKDKDAKILKSMTKKELLNEWCDVESELSLLKNDLEEYELYAPSNSQSSEYFGATATETFYSETAENQIEEFESGIKTLENYLELIDAILETKFGE